MTEKLAEKLAESAVYAIAKQILIEEGKSEDYADCIIKVLHYSGVTNDVISFDTIVDPKKAVQKLLDKAHFADIICSAGGPIVCILGLILFVLAVCCCCQVLLKCCFCCGKQKPVIVQVIAGMPNSVSVFHEKLFINHKSIRNVDKNQYFHHNIISTVAWLKFDTQISNKHLRER